MSAFDRRLDELERHWPPDGGHEAEQAFQRVARLLDHGAICSAAAIGRLPPARDGENLIYRAFAELDGLRAEHGLEPDDDDALLAALDRLVVDAPDSSQKTKAIQLRQGARDKEAPCPTV